MNTRQKIVFIIMVAAQVGQGALCQSGECLSFFSGDTMHLRWNGKSGAGIIGYSVYRQEEGTQDWQLLTRDPLSIVTDRQEVEDRIGYRRALYFSLFGIKEDTVRLTRQQVESTLGNPQARGFLELMSTVNPEFAELLGLMYHDASVRKGSQYRYRIKAVQSAGSEEWIQTDWIGTDEPGTVPPASGLEGLGDDGRISLSWDKKADLLRSGTVVTYNVYRAEQLLGPYSQRNIFGILPIKVKLDEESDVVDNEQFVDDLLENGKTFYYFVKSVNAFGFESDRSITIEVTVGNDVLPGIPKNLRATLSAGIVRLDWDNPDDITDGYFLYKSQDPNDEFERIWPGADIIRSGRTFFLDKSMEEGQTYYYTVRSTRAEKLSANSDTLMVEIPDFTAPDPPQEVEAKAIDGGILISWAPNNEDDILGYEIERTSDTAFSRTLQLNALMIPGTEYLDSIIKESPTTYGYRVFAYDQNYNRSRASDLVKARMPDIVPPQAPFITSFYNKGAEMNISWTKSIDRELLEYRLYQAVGSSDWQQVESTQETSLIYSLPEYGEYKFAVTAVDSADNESSMSRFYRLAYTIEDYPEPPDTFKVEINQEGHVLLSWLPVKGNQVKGYQLTRRETAAGNMVDLPEASADQFEYIDKRVQKGKTYIYSIRTMNTNWKMSSAVRAEISIR